jgi:molybdate transport system ATP-binding protein
VILFVDIQLDRGDFSLDVRFEREAGLIALAGPSGAGKTTVVNAIAGLARPRQGRIVLDKTVLFDAAKGIDVPVHKRRLGYVFQEGRLFPHLSVQGNLDYGLALTPRDERRLDPAAVIDLLGIGDLLTRRPAHLSGGERQRVAIGRALLASPRLLLMDEPLAALDRARKAQIIPYIERLRDDLAIPIIYVSHADDEVARLATSIVTLAEGRVVAPGANR